MSLLRFMLGFFLFSVILTSPVWPQVKASPFQLRILNAPASVQPGTSYQVTIEIKNTQRMPLTLCLLPGLTQSWTWRNKNGSGTGRYQSGFYKSIIATSYDPVTKEFHCRTLNYAKDDFVTIPANASYKIDLPVEVPEDWHTRSIQLDLHFASNYDGSKIGFNAWMGKSNVLKLSFPVEKKSGIVR